MLFHEKHLIRRKGCGQGIERARQHRRDMIRANMQDVRTRLTRRGVLGAAGAAMLGITPPRAQQQRVPVVATFSILGDLANNVGGERIACATLVAPDGDVHVYAPTAGDAARLAGARAVIRNGLGLEGWIERLIGASGTKAVQIVASDGVAVRELTDRRDGRRPIPDPHAWQSVANAKIYVTNIREGLSGVDAAGAEVYAANSQSYLAKLDALEQDVVAAIAAIPAERRKVITTHNAFGYFGAAYGITFLAVEGVSTDEEPSARQVGNIIAQIKAQHIRAVFLENITDPRLLRQIAEETGARIGGTLYSDALSPPDGPAGSYIAMMRHNADELRKALA
jgi:zinc/manganese transport system substrate-binding protein